MRSIFITELLLASYPSSVLKARTDNAKLRARLEFQCVLCLVRWKAVGNVVRNIAFNKSKAK